MSRRKESDIRLLESHAEVELTQGLWALIDLEDVSLVSGVPWCLLRSHGLYAYRQEQGRAIYLHRFIMGLQRGDGWEVDHLDGDGLNNQKSNLKVVPPLDNQRRKNKRK